MSATNAQIAQLRRMCALSDSDTTYTDSVLSDYIESYPVMDERGEVPYTWDASSQPPTEDENDDWIETYDLFAAAGDIWSEKAAALAANYDFKADEADLRRSQAYRQAQKQARYYRARRRPTNMKQWKMPKESELRTWIGNLPEPD